MTTEGIHLYVDDQRTLPEIYFTHLAETSAEAIAFLEANKDDIVTVSLDHDLGYDYISLTEEEANIAAASGLAADTARPIVKWMHDNNWWPLQLFIHSSNPYGAQWLLAYAKDYAPKELSKYYEIVNDRTYR